MMGHKLRANGYLSALVRAGLRYITAGMDRGLRRMVGALGVAGKV